MTDGQTDRQTDLRSQDRASIAALRGKNQPTFVEVINEKFRCLFLLTAYNLRIYVTKVQCQLEEIQTLL